MNRKEFLKVGLGALTMTCLPVKGESKYQVKGKTWHEVHLDVIDEITKEMNQYWSTHTEGTLVDRRVGLYNHMQNRFKTYYSSLFDNGIVRWLGVQPITEVSGAEDGWYVLSKPCEFGNITRIDRLYFVDIPIYG